MGTRFVSWDTDTNTFAPSVQTSIDNRFANALNVKSYGAVGNGDDATAAFTNAVTAAKTQGKAVRVPSGRYIVGNVDTRGVEVFGDTGAVLVQRSDTESIFVVNSTETGVGSVAADIVPGATSVTLSGYTAGLLNPGDIVVIWDTVSADPNAETAVSGELLEVASVSGQVVQFKTRVQGSFTAAKSYTLTNGVKIARCNMIRGGVIRDLTFEGRDSAVIPLIQSYYERDARYDRLRCTKGGDGFLRIKMWKNVTVTSPVIENLVDDLANNHLGYGIHASNSGDGLQVIGLVANNVRHGFTTSGGGKGIPRNINVINPKVSGCNNGAGIDTHAPGDNIVITGGVVTSSAIGVTIRSKNTHVVGTEIRQCIEGIRWAETMAENTSAHDVAIYDSTYGMVFSDAVKNTDVAGCVIRGAQVGVDVRAAIVELTWKHNTIKDCRAEGMVFVSGALDVFLGWSTVEDASMVTASASINITGTTSETVPRFDMVGMVFRQRKTALASRAVNSARKVTVVDSRLFGTFTSSTKINLLTGSVAANNLEYA
jgi:hypothetical protein